jgi:hypothetical protein
VVKHLAMDFTRIPAHTRLRLVEVLILTKHLALSTYHIAKPRQGF